MSVVSNLRSLSDMEFYRNAMRIRTEVTKWMLRNFGERKRPKDVRHTIKDITEEEQKAIDAIFLAHGQSVGKEFVCEYPDWFVSQEQQVIAEILWQMMGNIIAANSIYATVLAEADLRRCRQDDAIGAVHKLYYELDYIARLFPQNMSYFEPLLASLEREDHLLKGWRQSDNRKRKELKK